MAQFRTLFSLISIISASMAYGQDSTRTLTIPLFVADSIIADLERLNQYKVVTKIQDKEINMMARQIQAKDSIITFQQTECRSRLFLSEVKTNDLKVALGDEKKRRKANGIWRNVFILTTAGALYLAITNQY